MDFLSRKKLIIGIIAIQLIVLPLILFAVKQTQETRSRADLSDDVSANTVKLLADQGNETEQISTSLERKEQMKALGREDPDKFLLNVISEDIKATLPLTAQENIEKKVEMEGVILVEEVDEQGSEKNTTSSVTFQVLDDEGYVKNSYQVFLREGMTPEFPGRVKVKGYLLDDILIPITIGSSQNVLGISTTGNLKIGVVMVNFKNDDSDIRNDFTREQLANIYFTASNSVAKYLTEASMGALNVRGDINDVYGWIDLPEYTRKQVCDIYERDPDNRGYIRAINQLARQEATARGKSFGDYDVIGYVFPAIRTEDKNDKGTNCYWNAITKGIPGDSVVSPVHFLNGDYDGVNDVDHGPLDGPASVRFYSGILAHEVGHSLGLSHAHGMICGNKQIDSYSNCSIYGYGDRFDLIGGAWDYHPHTNAKNKIMMNWIPASNMRTVNASGEYNLYSASKNRPAGQTQLIKIDRPNASGNYYLEYRSKDNGDGNSFMPSAAYRGAMLRLSDVDLPEMDYATGGRVNEWRTKQTYLIDVDKSDSSLRGGLLSSSFKDNLVFEDKRNQITIKQISHNDDLAKLSITFGPPPCERTHPSMTFTEPTLSGKAGEKLRYEIKITNNNSPTCNAGVFALSIQTPSGWTSQFIPSEISIAPNEQKTVYVDITSPLSATLTSNPHSMQVTVKNKARPEFFKTKEIRYNIESTEPTASVSPTSTPTPSRIPPPTPSRAPTPSPTRVPTPSPTRALTPTPTRVPTGTPVPTVPPGETAINFKSIKLHGIGKGGDNVNPNAIGNSNPLTKTRPITVGLKDGGGRIVSTAQGSIVYNPTTGDFSGNVRIDSSVNSGLYQIAIKTPKYVSKNLEGTVNLVKGSTFRYPETSIISLVTGDANGDGKRNLLDFNAILDCYSEAAAPRNCSDPNKKSNADITDDGLVNYDDLTLYLRESSVIDGD